MIFKKRVKCFICDGPVNEDGATLKYRYMGAKGKAEIGDLNLCKSCGDKMEVSDGELGREEG